MISLACRPQPCRSEAVRASEVDPLPENARGDPEKLRRRREVLQKCASCKHIKTKPKRGTDRDSTGKKKLCACVPQTCVILTLPHQHS
jgi:hypothetical protein